MKRILGWAGAALLLSILGLAASVVATIRETRSIREGVRLDGVEVVKDGFVAVYLLDLGGGSVALIDAGNDPEAKAILRALERRGLGPDAVEAILLTHGDRDHVAGAARFPRARVMALAPDVALAEGRAARGPAKLLPSRPTGLRVTDVLADGGTLDLRGTPIRVFAVPGHTPGSAAFFARGVVFLGDSCALRRDGRMEQGWWFSNDDTSEELASLTRLALRLAPVAASVRAVACAHSAVDTVGYGSFWLFVKR